MNNLNSKCCKPVNSFCSDGSEASSSSSAASADGTLLASGIKQEDVLDGCVNLKKIGEDGGVRPPSKRLCDRFRGNRRGNVGTSGFSMYNRDSFCIGTVEKKRNDAKNK
ncbi:hypothetical protein [Candidatus Ichthyocystis sparus]|uniref:hypothetical protein n=1 Tax=Candidatus Ichthyocystis sparus TaxID=1561004 RepID=UPI000B81E1E5|nr:hypothetical protein [Candidatus Ichthyocystis sparus]